MNIVQEELSPLHLLITVNMEPQDVETALTEKLKVYRKDIQLKGFRKGKVPLSVVRGMVGQNALGEAVNELLSKSLEGYVKEQEFSMIGYPIQYGDEKVDLNVKDIQPYSFKFQIGLEPDFDLPLMDGSETFIKRQVFLSDEDVREEIAKVSKAYGEQKSVEDTLLADDVINIQLVELDGDGEVLEDGIMNDAVLSVGQFDLDTKAELLNIKKGESIVVDNIWEAIAHSKEQISKHVLDLSPEFMDTANPQFKIIVTDAKRVEPAEWNQEFFDKVFGPGAVDSEEAFVETFKGHLESLYQDATDQSLRNQVADRLMTDTNMEFPERFLQSWVESQGKQGATEEEVEKDLEGLKNHLKFSLIKRKIGKEFQEEVGMIEDKDLLDYALHRAELQFKSKFQFIVNNEVFSNMVSSQLREQEKYRTRMVEDLFQQRVLEVVIDKNAVVTEEVALEEFMNENANA